MTPAVTNVQVPAAAIRDTAAAVFDDPAFQRSTLLQRIGAWLLDLLEAVLSRLRPGGASEPLFWILVGIIVFVLLALLARGVLLILADGRAGVARGGRMRAGRAAPDAWAWAARLAGAGDYTAAAHALYAAAVSAIASRGEVELHDSKTIGDYTRELARRSSQWLSGFRAFARSYETVIYGLGGCDRDTYERLHGLARPLVEARG